MNHTKTFSKTGRARGGLCRRLAAAMLCLAALLPLTGCGETREAQSQVFAMDTVMTLTAYGKNGEAGLSAATDVITAMDAMLDPELSTSTVYKINNAEGASTPVSGQIAKMISTAQLVYTRSGGALDLTIYPLVKLWGFVDGKYYVPTDEEISAEMAKFCFDKLVLTSYPSTGSYSVTIPSGGQMSFAAVAKGCTSTNAIEAMRLAGVTSGIISLGGNVQTLGLKPDGTNWNVAVQDPNNTSSYLGVISVGETAVITSGSYQRNFTSSKGKTYHHILNPATGYPANNSLVSVTIICEDGTLADCLSTAMFVLGENKALNYWRTYGGFEMILVTTGNQIICTKGLIEKFNLTNDSYTLKFTE